MRLLQLLLVACAASPALAQLSKPIASNKQMDVASNKYLQRMAVDDDHGAGWGTPCLYCPCRHGNGALRSAIKGLQRGRPAQSSAVMGRVHATLCRPGSVLPVQVCRR